MEFKHVRTAMAIAATMVFGTGCSAVTNGGTETPDPVRMEVDLSTYLTPRSERPTLMVMDFDYATVAADLTPGEGEGLGDLIRALRGQGSGDQERSEENLGAGIAQIVINGMLEAGQFRIMERKALDEIMREQGLANSDAADPNQRNIVHQAKLLGAQYMLTGAITQMGFERNQKGVGVGGLGIPGLGAIGKRDDKTRVSLTARLVDTSTGEIVLAVTGEGVSTKGGGLVLGGAGRGGGLAFGSTQSNVKESAIGEATDMAVHNLLVNLAERWQRIR